MLVGLRHPRGVAGSWVDPSSDDIKSPRSDAKPLKHLEVLFQVFPLERPDKSASVREGRDQIIRGLPFRVPTITLRKLMHMEQLTAVQGLCVACQA